MELAEHFTRNMISSASEPIVVHTSAWLRLHVSVGAGGVGSSNGGYVMGRSFTLYHIMHGTHTVLLSLPSLIVSLIAT